MKTKIISKNAIPVILGIWAVFVIVMYCKVFIIPKFMEFISR